MRTTTLAARLAWLAALAAGAGPAAGAADGVVIERCIVSLGEDGEAQVAAREAGVIEELAARKGMEVRADADLAILDSDQPRMEREKAQAELDQAEAKAASDVDERFAVASEGAAKKAYEKAEQSHRSVPGSVTDVERDRLRLEWEKTKLQIEQSQLERKLSGLAAKAKGVEVAAATHAIDRRRIRSPIAGMVLDVFKHKGEWMQPGDVLAHVIRTDMVQVEGYVEKPQARGIVPGTPVKVLLGAGKPEEFTGEITYVRPKEESGEYRIYAQVANRRSGDTWLLQLGQEVTMHVLVGPAAPAGK
ncbi:MAG: efflux RND transporter periplasmic adaptor subunit [Planctomycetaceae bacterium]